MIFLFVFIPIYWLHPIKRDTWGPFFSIVFYFGKPTQTGDGGLESSRPHAVEPMVHRSPIWLCRDTMVELVYRAITIMIINMTMTFPIDVPGRNVELDATERPGAIVTCRHCTGRNRFFLFLFRIFRFLFLKWNFVWQNDVKVIFFSPGCFSCSSMSPTR